MRRAALLALLAALGGCADAEAPARYAAPARPRAALVLEPPVVAVGQVAEVELLVVTAPDHSVRPVELPGAVPGFWLVSREVAEVVREPSRWVHTTRVRLRAVEVGRFEFPGGSVEVVSPEGAAAALLYDALPLEVVSTLAGHPTQTQPYAVRLLPFAAAPGARGNAVAFAAGAALGLAGAFVLALARRRLAARAVAPSPEPAAQAPAWEVARREIARSRDRLAVDPRGALDAAAGALRAYAVARFGGDASVRTTEELVGSPPPFTMTTRFPRFLEILAALDAARFPARDIERARAAALLDAVAAFVEESAPREAA
jgi:hypothetical protein